ncbi:MAG TPA: hypothetical protein VGK30_18660 [Candidatus Binatia bacterium]|jgi:hypothetical protein
MAVKIDEARALFGDAMLGPDDVALALGTDAEHLASGSAAVLSTVPFELARLQQAKERGHLLVFRTPTDGTAPLTARRLLERLPGSILAKLMQGVGYQLKDEWTLDAEPFFSTETNVLEWRLVHREPVPATRNLTYHQQDAALVQYADAADLDGLVRRRSAVAMIYDTLLFAQARGVKLLEHAWDWSSTPTGDGGYITAGELSADGLRVLGYSRAVRFGTLGVCPEY